jgi:hypothetical protein
MIKPTVGRVVWYQPSDKEKSKEQSLAVADQPLAAHVCYVHSDHLVNLLVIDMNGFLHSRTNVMLVQEGEDKPISSYCEWMPYQKGQAAKVEALEQKLEEAQPS